MSQSAANNGVHCNNCHYEGAAKTNSSTLFLIFFVLLCTSVFYLPLIIVALVYMGYVVAKPAKKSCPQCKSADVRDLTDEEAGITIEKSDNNTPKSDDKA